MRACSNCKLRVISDRPASSLTVGAWVESIAGASLKERAQRVREAEEHTGVNLVADVAALQRPLSDRAPLPDGSLVSDPTLSTITSIEGRRSAWVLRRSARLGCCEPALRRHCC
jgi:hypothetical protein